MSTVHISLRDILGAAVSCNVAFKPADTPFADGDTMTVSGSRSVRVNSSGIGRATLEPGQYTVRFLGIPGNTDTLSIVVPEAELDYSLTELLASGANVLTPSPDYLRRVELSAPALAPRRSLTLQLPAPPPTAKQSGATIHGWFIRRFNPTCPLY